MILLISMYVNKDNQTNGFHNKRGQYEFNLNNEQFANPP
jgi:hypothetical protein